MAKTIKFNLILDGHPIRDIKGLQEHFCIDDILDLYQKGRLQKWLKVRGFDEYLKNIEAIKEDESTIIQLIQIFDIHHPYADFMAKITASKEDMIVIQMMVTQIEIKYLKLFEIDFQCLFLKFKTDVPLFIYAVLMNENLRTFFLDNQSIKHQLNSEFVLSNLAQRQSTLYKNFSLFNKNKEVDENKRIKEIQDKIKLHVFKGNTDHDWKCLESNQSIMVLSIPENTYIRSVNNPNQTLSSDDVNGNFPILTGLSYKSNTDKHSIVYIEQRMDMLVKSLLKTIFPTEIKELKNKKFLF